MYYKVYVSIYGKKRNGDSKFESILCLGNMTMPDARGLIDKFRNDNPTKSFVTSYSEVLFSDSAHCNQQCLDCPLKDSCPDVKL